jgi:hypothetical protein
MTAGIAAVNDRRNTAPEFPIHECPPFLSTHRQAIYKQPAPLPCNPESGGEYFPGESLGKGGIIIQILHLNYTDEKTKKKSSDTT